MLYKYLQDNTRYINVSLKVGGLQPKSALYVCENKYGDCKALTNYMQALLEYAGIQSNYTLVYAGRRPKYIKIDYPSQQFNHVILSVPMEKDTLWLDCTDKTAPFNYAGIFIQNRSVLLIDNKGGTLTRSPALQPADVEEYYNININVVNGADNSMQVEAHVKGALFDYLRGMDEALKERDKLEYFEDADLFEFTDVQQLGIKRPSRDSSQIIFEVDAQLNNAVEQVGGRLLIKPIKPFYLKLEKPEVRTQELRFDYPINVKDSITYNLPEDVKVLSGIKPLRLESDYGVYNREVLINGHQLTINRHLLVNAACYSVEEYSQVYNFLKACINADLQKGMITFN